MRDQSLRGHVQNLEQQGELIRVDKETDPHGNVAAIGWKTYDRFGKSTLYTNLKNFSGWQLVSQIVTDRRKWAIGFGVSEEDVIPTLVQRIEQPIEPILVEAADAPVKEIVLLGDAADVTKLPAMWTSEDDPGPYIAAGMAVIKDPDRGLASTTTTPRATPEIRRLRRGKWRALGWVPGAISEMMAPWSFRLS